jgi:lysophospholipase L1-like esterase
MYRKCLALAALLACPGAFADSRIVVPEHPDANQRAGIERVLNDWPALSRYAGENATLPPPAAGEKRVVFMGDSITDSWGRSVGEFFPGRGFINRGISGQTTPQMLVRFRADVIALKPAAVVILAGTNDIAGNTGPSSVAMIEDNFSSMVDLARAHGIRVVLASILPINNYVTKDQADRRPPATIRALNDWMRDLARRENLTFVDYYAAMVDGHGMMKKELSDDGLHPNAAGYAVMTPLALKAITDALSGAGDSHATHR